MVLPHGNDKGCRLPALPRKNNPLWEALKFLLILLLILLIATPQLVIAVLLMIAIGAIMEAIRKISSLSTSSRRRPD